jgi:hypothetical protein
MIKCDHCSEPAAWATIVEEQLDDDVQLLSVISSCDASFQRWKAISPRIEMTSQRVTTRAN